MTHHLIQALPAEAATDVRAAFSRLKDIVPDVDLYLFELLTDMLDDAAYRPEDKLLLMRDSTFFVWFCALVYKQIDAFQIARLDESTLTAMVKKRVKPSSFGGQRVLIAEDTPAWFRSACLLTGGKQASDTALQPSAGPTRYPVKNAMSDLWFGFFEVIRNATAEAKLVPQFDVTVARIDVMQEFVRLALTKESAMEPRLFFDLVTLASQYINLYNYQMQGDPLLSALYTVQHFDVVNFVIPGFYRP